MSVQTTNKEKLKKILDVIKADRADKAKQLKELLEMVNEGLSRKEFMDSFQKVINHTLKLEVKALEKINRAIKELKDGNNTSLQATQGDLRALSNKLEVSINNALKEQENGLNFIRDQVNVDKASRGQADTLRSLVAEKGLLFGIGALYVSYNL